MTPEAGEPQSFPGPVRAGSRPWRLAVLISGRGSNLKALIEACANGRIDGTIVTVVSNRPQAPGLEHARAAGIARTVVDHRSFPDRTAFDRELAAALDSSAPDLVILAGFMRVLTPEFVNRFAGRMVNIHPSLLPALRGLDTHARALAAGMPTHGASVHFVTSELDGGPVIMQARVPVCAGDTSETLAARVQLAEHRLYPAAIALICSGRIQSAGGTVLYDGQPLERPLLLDELPEAARRCTGSP
ncbi:Phosphoribosylglycinamide formyltransferase [Thioalkalivibrio nitratireducens DSM 14787]|uniref:Phosphoribosylglycinamide formyltransferase n=1 Tax=Thioalkalivibrio nitratireducens (strain DSM 14787 / UNIQEM 213 / ALEN2) TaxID=1255043 RepID=L0E325_THIND|nr:phosphoribosylglycinamide formyltransferase [Thioalkalivibrio nitratireducens]AGA35036.1 Phosphoribosylglycinamide formyltransferase [Thioalkalivibrio nitratireducens DSM 14787]